MSFTIETSKPVPSAAMLPRTKGLVRPCRDEKYRCSLNNQFQYISEYSSTNLQLKYFYSGAVRVRVYDRPQNLESFRIGKSTKFTIREIYRISLAWVPRPLSTYASCDSIRFDSFNIIILIRGQVHLSIRYCWPVYRVCCLNY